MKHWFVHLCLIKKVCYLLQDLFWNCVWNEYRLHKSNMILAQRLCSSMCVLWMWIWGGFTWPNINHQYSTLDVYRCILCSHGQTLVYDKFCPYICLYIHWSRGHKQFTITLLKIFIYMVLELHTWEFLVLFFDIV